MLAPTLTDCYFLTLITFHRRLAALTTHDEIKSFEISAPTSLLEKGHCTYRRQLFGNGYRHELVDARAIFAAGQSRRVRRLIAAAQFGFEDSSIEGPLALDKSVTFLAYAG